MTELAYVLVLEIRFWGFKSLHAHQIAVVVAQLVERQVVVLDVAGSIPVDHPIITSNMLQR